MCNACDLPCTKVFLQRLDGIQDMFLEDIGVDAKCALLKHNLAPLACRRDIAMLAIIHRSVLDKGPAQFKQHIRAQDSLPFPRGLRQQHLRHNKQLHDPIGADSSHGLQRSLVGLIYPYNLMPQSVVDADSLSKFQKSLQNAVKNACLRDILHWETVLSTGARELTVSKLHFFFRLCSCVFTAALFVLIVHVQRLD